MTHQVRSVLLVLLCVLALVASGCIETALKYNGNRVSDEHVIALEEGAPKVGTWETFDLIIAYKYIIDGDVLEISGQADLGDHQRMVYDRVRFLDIYLFFLDEDSRVLETVVLDNTLTGSPERSVVFLRSYNIPDGARAISFGYSGMVTEKDGRMPFYLLPLD